MKHALLLIPLLLCGLNRSGAADAAADALPAFHHLGVVLDYRGLKYNPCDDVIIPSVIKAYQRFPKPLGRYYLYYAPHNAPGGICVAYSDALEGPWKEYTGNPLIQRDWPPHYKVSHVSGPEAIWIEEEHKLFLYYHGENNTTRYASSTDGVHFTYEGVAVTTQMFDDTTEASYARVFRHPIAGKDNRYLMLLMGNEKGTRKIYLAWSKNGRQWETQRQPLFGPQTSTGQLAQAWLFLWQGKQYLVYHDYDEKGTDLQVSEVDPAFQHVRYIGIFYDRRSVSPDNVAQMSPCIVEEEGKLYLFTNIGPRLHQKIALAIAEPQRPDTAHRR